MCLLQLFAVAAERYRQESSGSMTADEAEGKDDWDEGDDEISSSSSGSSSVREGATMSSTQGAPTSSGERVMGSSGSGPGAASEVSGRAAGDAAQATGRTALEGMEGVERQQQQQQQQPTRQRGSGPFTKTQPAALPWVRREIDEW